MKRKKSKKTSATKKIIITLTILSISLAFILFSIKQNHDSRSKAQATTINPPTAAFPSKLFAPFVDVNLYPLFDFSGAYAATGLKFYTLAFILNSGSCSPAWGGTTPANSTFLFDQINFLRNNGGDVIISFGGEGGSELAQSCITPQALQAAYQQVITQYKIRWIDMDIEGSAIADATSIDRRNKALAALQTANPGLKISYTLPVLPSGLTQDGLNLLSNAKSNGVNITAVNLMTMNFGDGVAPNPIGQMGKYSIQALNSTRTQVQGLGITTSYGITPMIGQNNTQSEIFLLTDVPTILNESKASDIIFLSMWSASRDNGGCPNQGSASATCSGISQATYDFIKAFLGFTGPPTSPAPFTSSIPTAIPSPTETPTPTPTPIIPTYTCIGLGKINCIDTPTQNSPTILNPKGSQPPINPGTSNQPPPNNPQPPQNAQPFQAILLILIIIIIIFLILLYILSRSRK
jgi:hypothetical protein